VSIDIVLWKSLIEGLLFRISDEEYQRLAWFNRHAEQTSPGELINQLYHDYNFELFVDDDNVGLTPSQREAARAFLKNMSDFCDQTDRFMDPYATIDDPRWDAIRRAAKSLLLILFPRSLAARKRLRNE
jgi:hypothetical protein